MALDLRWLLVIRPADAQEGLSLAGALLSGTLRGPAGGGPAGPAARHVSMISCAVSRPMPVVSVPGSSCWSRPRLAGSLRAALAGSTGLRLELERRAWLRLGRDVVGQRTAVAVAKNRYGPPGRSVDLDIHYLTDGERVAGHPPAGSGRLRPPPEPGRRSPGVRWPRR